MLPEEMWWPLGEHDNAHRMVDAVYNKDLQLLVDFKRTWPEHEFGFETYTCWLEQTLPQSGMSIPATIDRKRSVPDLIVPPGKPIPIRTLFDTYSYEVRVRIDLVRWPLAAVLIRLRIGENLCLLSEAFIDPTTNSYKIAHHDPSHYIAEGVDPLLLFKILDTPAPNDLARHRLQCAPAARAS